MATYADLEHFTYADLERLSTPPPPRPRTFMPWADLRELLVKGLVSGLRTHGRTPTQKAMCKALGVPEDATTLSHWVNDARHAAGLSGGYREAMRELLPDAQRRVGPANSSSPRTKSG